MKKVSGNTRELGNPPGRVVWWTFTLGYDKRATEGKTAFEAAAKVGILLSQCTNITWGDEEPYV